MLDLAKDEKKYSKLMELLIVQVRFRVSSHPPVPTVASCVRLLIL